MKRCGIANSQKKREEDEEAEKDFMKVRGCKIENENEDDYDFSRCGFKSSSLFDNDAE